MAYNTGNSGTISAHAIRTGVARSRRKPDPRPVVANIATTRRLDRDVIDTILCSEIGFKMIRNRLLVTLTEDADQWSDKFEEMILWLEENSTGLFHDREGEDRWVWEFWFEHEQDLLHFKLRFEGSA